MQESNLSRADTARRVLLYAAGVYHIEPPEAGEIAELTKEVSAIGRNVNQAVRAMNAAVLRGQKIPRLQLDQLAHHLQQIARHNDKARNLMVRRARQQRTHVDQIVEVMKGEGPAAAPDRE